MSGNLVLKQCLSSIPLVLSVDTDIDKLDNDRLEDGNRSVSESFSEIVNLVTRDAIRRVKKDVLRDDLDKVFKCLFLVSDRDKLFGTLLVSSIRTQEADSLTYLERVFWFGVTGHYEWIFGCFISDMYFQSIIRVSRMIRT